MRLKKWWFSGLVAAIAGLLLLLHVEFSRAKPETDSNPSRREESRTWTDRSGTYHLDAALVEFKDGKVTLKKKDGTTLKVLLHDLIETDRQYVEAYATGAGSEGPTSSPGSEPNDLSTRSDDESVRTEARESVSTHPRARTSYRTTARTTARTTVGSSDNRGARRVTVDGVGATADEALKDCFRKAVSTVMGSIIDAETRVENDRLVLERILTLSDGYVESYEELGKAYSEGGLVHRRIVAVVRRDSLLVACGRADSVSVDASGLYPEVMTKLERRRNALALLRKTLGMLPGSLLQIEVKRPPVEKLGDRATALGVQLVIRVDRNKYEAFQDRMVNILHCLSRQDGTIKAYSGPVAQAWEPARQKLLGMKFLNASVRDPDDMCVVDVEFADIEEIPVRAITGLLNGSSLFTGQNGGASLFIKGQSDWRWFDLDENVELSPMMATAVVAFRDSDGEEVKTTRLTLGPWVPGFAVLPRDKTGIAPHAAFMSPLFLYCHGGEDYPIIVAAGSATVRGGITLENELLSRVSTVDASVRSEPLGQMEVLRQEVKQTDRGLRRNPPDPTQQAEELASRARRAERARAASAANSARARARNEANQAAFQSMWRAALRRSGW